MRTLKIFYLLLVGSPPYEEKKGFVTKWMLYEYCWFADLYCFMYHGLKLYLTVLGLFYHTVFFIHLLLYNTWCLPIWISKEISSLKSTLSQKKSVRVMLRSSYQDSVNTLEISTF